MVEKNRLKQEQKRIRGSWGQVNPRTRIKESNKKYNRNKEKVKILE